MRFAARRTGVYANFLGAEGDERIRSAYPHGAYERLAAIKRRYDPANLFRLNQNIPPADGRATPEADEPGGIDPSDPRPPRPARRSGGAHPLPARLAGL